MRLAAIILLASGCYFDPINQRPSIDIEQLSSDVVRRGGEVMLRAKSRDPEGQAIAFTWAVYACSDATQPDGCDGSAIAVSFDDHIELAVPVNRAGGAPVQSLRVTLEAVDSLGAQAKPSQELVIPTEDAAPVLEPLRFVAPYHATTDPGSGVIGAPVQLYAEVSDPDDGPDLFHDGAAGASTIHWEVFSPTNATYTLDDLPLTDDLKHPDPMHQQFAKKLTPMGTGLWMVRVTATDPLGVQTIADGSIMIDDDSPPCLTQYAPIAAPSGQALPMPDPTLFQVLVVTDDLDPYPTVASDALRGSTSFTWSLMPPGGTTHQVLPGVTGASVALDPAVYTPGEVLELRVEIADRTATPLTCADADPTCSVTSNPSCIQRLTWRVEVQ